MYRQIKIHPKHRFFQHILWREAPLAPVQEYALKTITYGVNCAPYLALRVLRYIAANDCDNLPDVSEALLRQTYLDDICVGADSVEDATLLQQNLISTLARSGLELKKWASNVPQMLSQLRPEDCTQNPLTFDRGDGVQVLGMKWDPAQDHFSYDISSVRLVLTKRGILSMIARIFDPLGLLAPTMMYVKSPMQRLWLMKIVWDDPFPVDIQEECSHFYSSLGWLAALQIPRFIGSTAQCRYVLCGFCDASEKGYAALVYLRTTYLSEKVTIRLLGVKMKLAPMKTMSIPRLELCGAVLLTHWLLRLKSALDAHLTIDMVYAWSDSSIVLSWLKNSHTSFKIFVSNRIHQIQSELPECQWAHVTSQDNPADCASRGLAPSELSKHALYWKGPTFLCNPVISWSSDVPILTIDQLPETQTVSLITRHELIDECCSRFSSFSHMLRVVAYIRRFVAGYRRGSVNHGPLSDVEVTEALSVIARNTQQGFLGDLRSALINGKTVFPRPLARLCPFIDPRDVIRVGGRLINAHWSESRKHPIQVPRSSHQTMLIGRHWHQYVCHARPRLVTALISKQFWIPRCRLIAHKVLRQCLTCVKIAAVNPQPQMADLPDVRVRAARPFSSVGIDYAGPILMKELNIRKSRILKVYIAVFVCMCTKAVHLEAVTDLSTQAFMDSLDRFVARRGVPVAIYSDCGTNFVGAARQLQKLLCDPINRDQLSAHIACQWHFNPPSAPHFGGIWEAAVKSAKSLLVRSLCSQTWSLEEFTTILCRIESALNSRPLTPLSSDPNDLECLTPGHFLIGHPLMTLPDDEVFPPSLNIKNRWKLLQQVFRNFWRRWSLEYLNILQARGRWSEAQDDIKVGNMVVIKTSNSPPLSWPLGRIVLLR